MERVKLSSEIEFSRIIYGMWRLMDDNEKSVANIKKKVELCISQGITTIDQADIYGDYGAEEAFGNILKEDKSMRHKIEIITKCDIIAPIGKYRDEKIKYYDTSRKHIIASTECSLANMGTDYIDLLLLHRPDPLMDPEETGLVLDDLVKSGKVKAVGVSNFKPWDWELLQSKMKNRLLTNQIEFSLTANEALTNGDLSFHFKEGIPIMAWSPLGGGDLINGSSPLNGSLNSISERYDTDKATIALAWILAHPSKVMPVVGTNNLKRIAKIALAASIGMDRKTWFELYTAALGQEVP